MNNIYRQNNNNNEARSAERKMSNNYVRQLMNKPKRKHVAENQVLCSKMAHNSIKGMIDPCETVGKVYYASGCELTAPGQECKHAQPHVTSYGRQWTSKRIIKIQLGRGVSDLNWVGGIILTANFAGYKAQPGLTTQHNVCYTTQGYTTSGTVNFADPSMLKVMLNGHDESLLPAPETGSAGRLYTVCTGQKLRLLANTLPNILEGGSFIAVQSQTLGFQGENIASLLQKYPKCSIGSAADLEHQDITIYPTYLGIGALSGLQQGSTVADFTRPSEGGYLLVWFEVPYTEPPAGVTATVPSIYVEIETGGFYLGDGVPAVTRVFPDTSCLLSCKAAVEAVGDPNEILHFSSSSKMERSVVYHANKTEVAKAPGVYDTLAAGASTVWRKAKSMVLKELTAAIPALL